MASSSDCSCLAMPMSPDEFLVAVGRSIVSTAGWTGESTLKLGLMGVGASITIDTRN